MLAWISHPIRLSGLLAILFLAGPGSLQGLSLLLTHTGASPPVPPGAPQTHALLQTLGFFLILIWGFLVNGLPGMMGANVLRTRWIRIPMLITAAGLWLAWGAPAWAGHDTWQNAGWIALFLGTLSGSWVLIAAATRTKGRWLKRPSFMLIPSLAIPPLGVLAAWWQPAWLQRGDYLDAGRDPRHSRHELSNVTRDAGPSASSRESVRYGHGFMGPRMGREDRVCFISGHGPLLGRYCFFGVAHVGDCASGRRAFA